MYVRVDLDDGRHGAEVNCEVLAVADFEKGGEDAGVQVQCDVGEIVCRISTAPTTHARTKTDRVRGRGVFLRCRQIHSRAVGDFLKSSQDLSLAQHDGGD